jgi:hypothetical protein
MTTLPRSISCLNRGFVRTTLTGTALGSQLWPSVWHQAVGVADPDFRRGNGSFSEVLVHCRGPNTWHVHGRAHIGEIEWCGFEMGARDCLPRCTVSRISGYPSRTLGDVVLTYRGYPHLGALRA